MSPKIQAEFARASHGDPKAQFALAEAYRTGDGVDKNIVEALRWYRAAATAGEPSAQFRLAMCWLQGEGVEQSDAEASQWLMRSAEQGYTEAVRELGSLYRLGRGVPQNVAAAAEFHTIAALAGDELSLGYLRDYRQEIEKAALSGSVVAALCLAKMFHRGLGVEKDSVLVLAWLEWAKAHGSRDNDADAKEEVDDMEQFLATFEPAAGKRRAKALVKEWAEGQAKILAKA
ncbi:tetratricopeptide repeat protein [Paraburkholderia sp. A3BS-1L]|uniref:tetratricopeptide repeat protein n=1 Tax=Paraburkholderia sp. A3BS-1L TaxID=3028375 RepID=UPI003DA9B19D